MDIKDRLTEQEKTGFENLRVETLVLERLVQEKRHQAATLLGALFQKLKLDPKLYGLEFNAGKDLWEAKLRPDALALPNRQERRHPIGG